ncbi:outer membrane assembly lipoprotein YfiO (plasmid) [Prevotella sp. oral taxon 299 str. F0039]|jgi:lipoprotein|nr:outer membrane assembly lipoprotein YfiO [Prevotella sp. oral taxon 299 str. F0039]
MYFCILKELQFMKNLSFIVIYIVSLCVFSSCANEFNQVYKTTDFNYKYEYAKECFLNKKYQRASILLQDVVVQQKGTDNAQECLYMLGMAQYLNKEYDLAAQTFKKYYSSYPKGVYAEDAEFYIGQSLYMSTPEPRLDQTQTIAAISAFQDYLDLFPDAIHKKEAQQCLFALQDKLIKKELYSAQLYFDLGTYFGNCGPGENNYDACIITAQNALKDYPYSTKREDFALLIMKSKFELATQSIDEKKLERYQDAEDECYGFINEYPDSKSRTLAEKYIKKCQEITKNKS